MSEQELIQTRLRAVAHRLQRMAVLRVVVRMGFWTCLGLLVLLAVYKILPLPFEVVIGTFLAGATVLLGACVVSWLRRVTLAEAARIADQKLALKERLSSAIELSNLQSPISNPAHAYPMTDLVLRDAAQHAESLNPSEVLPFRLPRLAHGVLACLVAIVGLAFVPAYRSAEYKEAQRAKQDVKREGERLVSLVKRIEQTTKPAVLGETRNELKSVEELGQEFRKLALTKEDALRDINTVADQIRKKEQQLGENKSLRTLERRAASSGSEPSAQQREQLQQKINDLQKKLGPNPPTPDQIDKMKSDLKQALDKLKSAPSPNSAEGQQAKQELEKTIESAMQQAQESGDLRDSLEKALEGLKSADIDMVAKNISDSVKDLDQMKQESQALNKAQQQQAQQAGKDLAEQLSKGQAQAAKQTLENLAKQLEQSGMSESQKQQVAQQVMKEVTKALDPAKDYGKVGEHLQNAAGQLAKNETTGAANSIQAAAEELQKLMDQQAAGQQMAQMMEALQRSQSQIATGNGNGQSQCQIGSTTGTPKGGKGRGFGDWPDENNTEKPEYSDSWDNSGLNRGEQDPKGVSDRGEPKITGNTTPTRLHGQMQNAGPMPGITLKGVSIKGQSNVEMEQSTAAAKQEAEDALNKEQIPKSYQGQVKEYFDSLK